MIAYGGNGIEGIEEVKGIECDKKLKGSKELQG